MQILTTGKNLDIGDALRSHIEMRINDDVLKYFDSAVRAKVVVAKQKSNFSTECSLHLPTGLILQAHGEAGDAHASVDIACEHLEKRLRRYKRRLKDHYLNHRQEPVMMTDAASFVISAQQEADEAEEPENLNPTIIAESSAQIAKLNVGEAVMQMDISDAPFVIFRNSKHGGVNVVYRRDDGHVGWVDPGNA